MELRLDSELPLKYFSLQLSPEVGIFFYYLNIEISSSLLGKNNTLRDLLIPGYYLVRR